jgi:hypothetical protein
MLIRMYRNVMPRVPEFSFLPSVVYLPITVDERLVRRSQINVPLNFLF